MKRVIWHWTAGGYTPNDTDRRHYHEIIDGNGEVVQGRHGIPTNKPPLERGRYAAHTLNGNSNSIGIAVAAMRGAREVPFSAGPSPLTWPQIATMLEQTAKHCKHYGIEVSRETTLSHAEVERTLGIKQRAKWDIMWLPDMDRPGDPIKVGDRLREMLRERMGEAVDDDDEPDTSEDGVKQGHKAPQAGIVAAIIAAIAAAFFWIRGR